MCKDKLGYETEIVHLLAMIEQVIETSDAKSVVMGGD